MIDWIYSVHQLDSTVYSCNNTDYTRTITVITVVVVVIINKDYFKSFIESDLRNSQLKHVLKTSIYVQLPPFETENYLK